MALYAFFFLTPWHALLQICFVGISYALLLSGTGPTDVLVTRWMVTMGTLLSPAR